MGHAATHCNTPATHKHLRGMQASNRMTHSNEHLRDMLQHTVNIYGTCCNTPATHEPSTGHASEPQHDAQQRTSMGHAATHSNTLQHTQTSMGHAATHYLQHTNIYGTCKRATAWRRGSSMDKGDSVPSATVHISHKSAS